MINQLSNLKTIFILFGNGNEKNHRFATSLGRPNSCLNFTFMTVANNNKTSANRVASLEYRLGECPRGLSMLLPCQHPGDQQSMRLCLQLKASWYNKFCNTRYSWQNRQVCLPSAKTNFNLHCHRAEYTTNTHKL